jgi:hypothetical protein
LPEDPLSLDNSKANSSVDRMDNVALVDRMFSLLR